MNNCDVSIVVPVYKVPRQFLDKCIKSIQSQTYQSIEIILVDDGSPDDCGLICDEYAQKDERIKVIHQNNGGLSAARNTGVREARGKWIMFVDGDDWVENDIVEKLIQPTNDVLDLELVFCGVYKDYGSKIEPFKYTGLIDKHVYEGKEITELQKRLLSFTGNIATAYAKLYLREFLVVNNIEHNEEFKLGVEGLDFNIRAFECLKKAFFIHEYLYHYMYNDNSITTSFNENNKRLGLLGFKRIREFIMTSKNKDELLVLLDDRMHFALISSAISGYFNPQNGLAYKDKVKKYKLYLSDFNMNRALHSPHHANNLSASRKFALFCIRHNIFWVINIMAKMRYRELQNKKMKETR